MSRLGSESESKRVRAVRGPNKRAVEPVVILSVRLPQRLVARVDSYADAETRTRLNMLQVLLQEALKSRDEKRAVPVQPAPPVTPLLSREVEIPLVEETKGRRMRGTPGDARAKLAQTT